MGLFLDDRTNNPIRSGNNTANLSIAVPTGIKLKIALKLCYKKAKCSLISLIYSGIPSWYLLFLIGLKKLRYYGGSFLVKEEFVLFGGKTLKRRVSVYLSIPVSIYLSAIAYYHSY